jgi:hypothetical protein
MTLEADVRVLFLNNLGRIADEGGLKHYIDLVNQGWSLGDVGNSLRTSQEASDLRRMVTNAYRTFLGREPEPGAVDFHVENSGSTSNQIIRAIRQSPEAAAFAKDIRNYVQTYTKTSGGKDDLVGYATTDQFKYDTSKFPGFGDGSAEYLGALDHWNRYGKNSGRIIAPADQPLIYVKNGELKLAADKYFSPKAKQRFETIINNVKNSNGGNYKQLITNAINSIHPPAKDNLTNEGGIDAIGAYYLENKVTPWDPVEQGAQPPVGGFDANYYAGEAPGAVQAWNNATSGISLNGKTFQDLDITGRYTYETYLQQHYTNTGRYAGLRANAAEEAELATQYEEKLTDEELQIYRDSILGLTKKAPTTSDPDNLTIDWEDETQSALEQASLSVLEARDAQEQQVFGALTQDALKQASQKLLEQKRKEANLSLFRGLPGYDEILSVNETLANSLLGDTGVGGILSITQDTEKTQESLEKQISQFTGISSNSTIYNWQNWFDGELTKRYQEMTEVMSPEDATQMLQVEQGFAQTFVDQYLKPRFDQSKSMDEFISYMDVKEEEQNIFQTQDAVNALKGVANVRAKLFYDQIKTRTGTGFDSDFYFNPEGNPDKENDYLKQKQQVAFDWEDAQKNGDKTKIGEYTWNQWAYVYGLDISSKNLTEKQKRDNFAKLHYQIKGAIQDFDPAKDVLTRSEAQNYINNTVVPALEEADIKIGDQPFLEFTTPEEFADELLEGISPEENKEEWNKILEMYGLDPLSASLEEVKDYIIEAVRTNQAQDIRESIKYLNEKKLKPTQERLGVTYIERDEDDKTVDNPEETALYTIFKNSGYAGSEDQFYDEFMSDTSKSEQQLLAKAMSGDLKLTEMSTDPFGALADVSSFFGTEEDVFGSPLDKTEEDDEPTTSSYFRLFEDDEAESTKSNAAESYISEFTSLFKGFK